MTCTITSLAADQEYVERVGRLLTDDEAERFRAHVRAAHAKLAPTAAPERIPGDIINDDPVELRPMRRLTFTSKPSTPGVKDGCGHFGADLESGAMLMGCAVAICAAVPIGILIAKVLASLSIYVGEHIAVFLF